MWIPAGKSLSWNPFCRQFFVAVCRARGEQIRRPVLDVVTGSSVAIGVLSPVFEPLVEFFYLFAERDRPFEVEVVRRIPHLLFQFDDHIGDLRPGTCFVSVISTSFAFTGFMMVCGTMWCSSLYAICISRLRFVSEIAAFIEPVMESA